MADPQPTASEVTGILSPVNTHDLAIFAGAAVMTVIFGVLGIWVKEFIAVAGAGFSTLMGAAAMYLKGK